MILVGKGDSFFVLRGCGWGGVGGVGGGGSELLNSKLSNRFSWNLL
jgi:hypothetical protein